ncbi:hypothetical protein FRC17_007153 [Serendipita sp. 399]|nr:hypothetical protein FRC17_007153 [Serendipita sp. 399]
MAIPMPQADSSLDTPAFAVAAVVPEADSPSSIPACPVVVTPTPEPDTTSSTTLSTPTTVVTSSTTPDADSSSPLATSITTTATTQEETASTTPTSVVTTTPVSQGESTTSAPVSVVTTPPTSEGYPTPSLPTSVVTTTPTLDVDSTSSTTSSQNTTAEPSSTAISCKAHYISQKGDTCASIGLPWGLSENQILQANSFLNCNDIWEWTPICIPDVLIPSTVTYSTATSTVSACRETYISIEKDTCDSIGTHFGVSGDAIYRANSFLNCNDIWPYTPICVPYPLATGTTTRAAPVPTSTPACSSYIASQPGQTCESIARNNGLVGSDIATANSFVNCNDIWPNTRICVPSVSYAPGCKHWLIVTSDYATSGSKITCGDAARLWGLEANDIYQSNTFVNCDDIWPGTQLCIPWKTLY